MKAQKPTHFNIFARGAGRGKPAVAVTDANGRQIAEAVITSTAEGQYNVQYVAVADGAAQVHVSYGGDPIPESPFKIQIAQGLDIHFLNIHHKNLGTYQS